MKKWGVPVILNLLLSIVAHPGLSAWAGSTQHCSLMLSEVYLSVVSQADLDLIEALSRDPVVSVSRPQVTRSLETPVVLHLKSGKKLIFKNNPETTRTSGMNKEVAAFLFDRMLKTDLVPLTVIRTEGEITGSAQLFVEGVMRTDRKYKTPAMKIFDFLIDTFDRTPENVVWGERNRAWAIDHGYTFNVAKTAVCPSPSYRNGVLETGLRVPGILQRLHDLPEGRIRAVLEPLLGAEPVNQLLERRTWLLAEAASCGWSKK
ncbi:MAG: hypothetical protein EBX52_09240 [Proteobacteria bacterium]|nr:hypothetical protein [Pseudomonadota bacterium]